jgi:hypothetical protein
MVANEALTVATIPASEPAWIFSHTTTGPHLEWEWAEKRLLDARNFWLATTALDGTPHVRPLWGFWQDGGFWFATVNRSVAFIEANGNVIVHTESGDEVVIVEGRCDRLFGKDQLQRISTGYKERYNHDTYATDEGVFTLAGYGGPGFKVTPAKVLGWIAPQFETATRWRFSA